MNYEVTPYTFVYLGGAAIAAMGAHLVWRRRSAPGARWLFAMQLSILCWTLADALDVSAKALSLHLFWGKVSYLGSSTVAVCLLLFALEYTNHSRWVTRGRIAALFAVPVFSIVAVFTNDWHQLIWSGYSGVAGSNAIVYHHGALYWVKGAYMYGVALAAAVILIGFALRARQTYRAQAVSIIAAMLVPLTGEVVYDFGPGLFPGLDLASITLALSGAILAFSLWRLKLLDLVPIARETVMEGMSDGIMVVDPKGRVVDINEAAAELVGATDPDRIGRPLDEITAGWPGLGAKLPRCGAGRSEFTLVSPRGRHVSLHVTPLSDAAGRRTGTVTVMRDITGHVDTEEALQQVNRELEERIHEIEKLQAELREQAIRDPLTDLFNRRYLSETLERELARAMREGYPVSLVMADIDQFKKVNDSFGHAAGDLVLRSLGAVIRADARPGDMACRYGGEEFLLVLPNVDAFAAVERADRLRLQVKDSSVLWLGRRIDVSLSLGVASFPLHGVTGEQVIAAADLALYQSKAAGRDRVTLAGAADPDPTPVAGVL